MQIWLPKTFSAFSIIGIIMISGELVGSRRRFSGIESSVGPWYKNSLLRPTRLCGDTNDGGPPFRYHKESKQCYTAGERGPCGDLMEFTIIDNDYGTCDCAQSLRCGRPLIYWPETRRCYYVNDQGPCSPGKWLVFGLYKNPVCKRNPCKVESARNPSRGTNFWFEHQRTCYRTGTRGHCPKGQLLLNSWAGYKPACSESEVVSCRRSGAISSTACLPGTRADYSDLCRRNPARRQAPARFGHQHKMPNIYHLTLE